MICSNQQATRTILSSGLRNPDNGQSVRESIGYDASTKRCPASSQTTFRLVSAVSARPSLAAYQRFVPHLAFGNHAAADTRCGRDSLLRALSGAIPRRECARHRAAGRSVATLVGTWLLQPRAQPA